MKSSMKTLIIVNIVKKKYSSCIFEKLQVHYIDQRAFSYMHMYEMNM